MPRGINSKTILTSLVIFLASIALIFLSFSLQDYLAQFQSLGLLGIFLINFFSTVTIFLPNISAASVVAGGNIYNPILVALVSTLGGVLGDSSSFILGKSGKDILLKKEGHLFNAVKTVFHGQGFLIIFFLALIPNPVFDAMGILAGLTRFPFKKFFIAMLLGRIVRNILLAYLGKSL